MPEINFTSKFEVNLSVAITPEEIRKNYLFGITLVDKDGNKLSDSVILSNIIQAIREIERFLMIKLSLQKIIESKTFFIDDWVQSGFIKTTYPANCVIGLDGYYGTIKQIEYPKDWLSIRRTNQEDFNRNLYIVPFGGGQVTHQLFYSQFPSTYIGFWSNIRNGTVPNYWQLEYVTGFKEIPADLKSLLGKMVSLQILPQLSDSYSKIPGASSTSLSLDGLSQSVSSFANSQGGIYGARTKQYSEEITKQLPILRDYYCGLVFDVA